MSKNYRENNEKFVKIQKNFYDLRPSPSEIAVYSILVYHAFNSDHPNECFPSMDRMMKFIKIGKKKLYDTLVILEHAGIIIKGKRERTSETVNQGETTGKAMNYYKLVEFDRLDEFTIEVMKNRLEEGRLYIKELNNEKKTIVLPENQTEINKIGFNIVLPENQTIVLPENQSLVSRKNSNNTNKNNNFETNNLSQKPLKLKILKEVKLLTNIYRIRNDKQIWSNYDNKVHSIDYFPKTHPIHGEFNKVFKKT